MTLYLTLGTLYSIAQWCLSAIRASFGWASPIGLWGSVNTVFLWPVLMVTHFAERVKFNNGE